MKQPIKQFTCLMTVLICSMFCSQIRAEDSWGWNPFAKSASSRDSSPLYSGASSTAKKSSWLPTWKTPKMPWQSSNTNISSYNRSKTSTWGKMSRTSKTWWKNTVEFLDPYPEPKPAKYAEQNSKAKSSNWFTGMFQKDEPKKVETLPDFLKQESPKF